jgi:hypothetical protein
MEKENEVSKDSKQFTPPTDGYIWGAEAYPEDEEFIAFQLMYTEDVANVQPGSPTSRRFFLKREDARLLAKMINEVLSAPDAETAWDNIAAHEAHEDIDFDDIPEMTPEQKIESDQAIADTWKSNGKVN